jgi:hypothetical protein
MAFPSFELIGCRFDEAWDDMPSPQQALRAIETFKDEYLLDFINVEEKCEASHFSSNAKRMIMRSSWQRCRTACVSDARNFA